MEMKEVVVEVPKKTDPRDVKNIIKKIFSFNAKKYYGKSKNFPKVRIKWQLSA
jgi:hypothetical protein